MKCPYCEENEARCIDELGVLCCGLCPIRQGNDSIKISDVAALLKVAREIERGGIVGGSCFEALRNILGRKPVLP